MVISPWQSGPTFKEAKHEWAGTGPQGTVAADGRGVSRARRQAPRTGRSASRTHRETLSLRTRTSRRSHPEEAEAAVERSDGGHPAASSQSDAADRLDGRRAGLIRTRIDPAGFPFIVGALAVAAAAAAVTGALAVAFLILAAFF